MDGLDGAEIMVKGVAGDLKVSQGQLTVSRGTSTWSCAVGDILGYRAKKPGLSGGFLCIEARGGQPVATGLASAMGHPQAVMLNTYGKWNSAQPLMELIDAHTPRGGGEVADPLAKVRSSKNKQMKLLDGLAAHLEAEEVVDAAVFGVYEVEILGSESVRNGVLAATDRRLIFFAKKVAGYDLESFPFENVSSFEKSKSMMGEKYSFFASGNKVEIKWVQESSGDDLSSVVTTRQGHARSVGNSSSQGQPSTSVADQLRELAALRQEGVITDEEFALAKAKLLNL